MFHKMFKLVKLMHTYCNILTCRSVPFTKRCLLNACFISVLCCCCEYVVIWRTEVWNGWWYTNNELCLLSNLKYIFKKCCWTTTNNNNLIYLMWSIKLFIFDGHMHFKEAVPKTHASMTLLMNIFKHMINMENNKNTHKLCV